MCQYSTPGCIDQSDDTHTCRVRAPERIAHTDYHTPTLQELEERVAYAEAAVSTYCSEFLSARDAERVARRSALEATSRWGRAWRELAEARKALARERESLALIARVVGRSEASVAS
jgi:hypothetical protein